MNQEKDQLGTRMKLYEGILDICLMPRLPIIARLDGRAFHTFTKGLSRPYDERMSLCMVELTKFLVGEFNAAVGYTESDEISLVWLPQEDGAMMFNGRTAKINSVLAASASVQFNRLVDRRIPSKSEHNAIFDCRVWNVPDLEEAANALLWREFDATKNSISMAASAYYSPAELLNKNGSEKQEMLFQKGVNWNDYPPFFKRGSYIMPQIIRRPFTVKELDELPPKHQARSNPDLQVERREIIIVELPPLIKIQNRVGFLFQKEAPKLDEGVLP